MNYQMSTNIRAGRFPMINMYHVRGRILYCESHGGDCALHTSLLMVLESDMASFVQRAHAHCPKRLALRLSLSLLFDTFIIFDFIVHDYAL